MSVWPGSRPREWRILRVVAASAAILLGGCDAAVLPPLPEGDVYEYRLPLDPPETLHWPVGSTVRIHVVNEGPDPERLRIAVAAAVDAWNEHALLDEYRLASGATPAAADVVLAWSGVALPVETSGCMPSGGRAQTTFCLDDQRLFTYPSASGSASRVKMIVTIGSVLANAPATTLDAVVAHELGHVLGIARHSDVATDLMFTDPARTAPSQRDVATVRALYRAPADILP